MIRMTRQRRAILSAFQEARRPLSPGEIKSRASSDVGCINLATVYRNLKAMVESGDLVIVEVLGQPDRYELSGLAHHHHFLCVHCDRLYDVPGCPGSFRNLAPRGFKLEGHELWLTGICESCA